MGKRARALGCCEAYKDKRGKACKGCPYVATLTKKARRKLKQRDR
jgi:hypothetical protein